MNFINALLGKSGLIKVPDTWRLVDGTPFLVEREPNINNIFTSDNPPSPRNPTQENRQIWSGMSIRDKRIELATAYLFHPDPRVRASTIHFAKEIDALGVRQYLVDLLADPFVRLEAAQAIWDRDDVLFSLRCLRDEINRTGFVSHMTPQEAWQAIQTLRTVQPNRTEDFSRWLLEAGIE